MSGRSVAAALATFLVGALVVIGVLLIAQRPVAAPSPSPTPTTQPTAATSPIPTATTSPSTTPPTPAECQNTYIAGRPPIVAPRKSGRSAEVALDSVQVGQARFGNATRWSIRAFNPTGSGGTFEMPLRATVRTSSGASVAVVGYEAGPPNAGSGEVKETVSIGPCDPEAVPGSPERGKVVLIVHTALITSGTYVLTLSDVKLPEGGTRAETWSLTLTCTAVVGPTQPAFDCR